VDDPHQLDYEIPGKGRSKLIPTVLVLGLTSGPLAIASAVLFGFSWVGGEITGFAIPFALIFLIGLFALATGARERRDYRTVVAGLIAAAVWLVGIISYVMWALHDNPM